MRNLKVILSIDGGGIRGVMPLVVLDKLNDLIIKNNLGTSINTSVDMVAGTSTGAIISAALLVKDEKGENIFTPNHLLELYSSRGPQIFNKERPVSTNEYPLKLILDNSFGKLRITDLSKYFVFVSYDEKGKRPFNFTNRMQEYRDVPLSKILLACSAVPEYFPPVELGSLKLSDGIKTAKNPSLIAYNHAQKYFDKELLLMISLGTGELHDMLDDDVEIEANKILETVNELSISKADLIHHRIQPKLAKGVYDMDDTSPENIKNLIEDASTFLEENPHLLDNIIKDWKAYSKT